jgi:predicted phage terminase large subunit-like protein
MSITPQQAAQELLTRREARRNLRAWNLAIGNQPAKHHDLINAKLQEITESPTSCYTIILMPPGAAKSTYASVAFPPWYLGKRPGCNILACSYSYTLAENFGRRARDLVNTHENILGFSLRADTKAAGEWETSTSGRYFCAGVGAGIAGHRADCGLIDDYLGNQEDADSLNIRDKQFAWFWQDFYPRLKPNASIIIIANRRHEDDLVGRLLDPKRKGNPIPASQWVVIKLPFFARDNDVLGRPVGARLWPEWFNEEMAAQINKLAPRMRSGLYQQEPAPEDGDFFKKSWFIGYEPSDLPPLHELKIYAASDHAISKRDDANKTCFGVFGIDSKNDIWWLPNGMFWQRADSMEQANEMLRLNKQYRINNWYAEKGHISQAIGPFLRQMMKEQKNWINIYEYTPKKDKPTRARSIQGLAATGRLRVPKSADWWPGVEAQLLAFPGSSEDDVVDMLAHLGRAVDGLGRGEKEVIEVEAQFNNGESEYTYARLKQQVRKQEYREAAFLNN